jgi:hypothetical protein
MRVVPLVLAVAIAALSIERGSALASDYGPPAEAAASVEAQEVDDNDDTRVQVQIVVLVVGAGTVFVLGTGAYFLRKRLGLVPPHPEQEANGHQ